jgi:tetratricopeptide (TPR) repeat protein
MNCKLCILFVMLPLIFLSFPLLYAEEAKTDENPVLVLQASSKHYLVGFCPDDSNQAVITSAHSPDEDYLIERSKDSVVIKLSVPSDRAWPFILRGDSLLKADKTGEAREQYFQALELDSLYSKTYVWIGDTYFGDNQYDQAAEWYQKCLEKNPADFQAYRFLADVYERQDELDKAMDVLISALIYNMNYDNAWYDLSRIGIQLDYPVSRHAFKQRCWMEQLSDTSYRICLDSSLSAQPEKAAAWLGFISEKAVWQAEGKFFEEYKTDERYSLTLQEIYDCFTWTISIWKGEKEENPQLSDWDLDFFNKVADDGFLEEYVLLEVLSQLNKSLLIKIITEENLLPRLREFFLRYYVQKT